MNNIQNYGSVNANPNYGKVNKSPNFKALIISDGAKQTLQFARELSKKKPTELNLAEKMVFDKIVGLLNKIRAIKPFAETTKFFDVVVGEYSLGLKKSYLENPIVNEYDTLLSEGNKIFIKNFGEKQLVAELKDESTAKKFDGELDFAKFCDLFKELEENAQTKVNDAMETLKELLGDSIKVVQK